MSYICKHCGSRHNQVSTAQQCAEKARNKSGLTDDSRILPSGHYLVEMTDTEKNVFEADIQVRCFVWGGKERYLVNVIDSEGKINAVSKPDDRNYLLQRIRRFGPRKALLRYGRHKEMCPICSADLVEQTEISSGVHSNPFCYNQVF